MIISRTPYRISFFGGGTDYPVWYEQYGGCVLAASISRYCYLTCRYLPPFFEHRFRVVYSVIETTRTVDEIRHPAVRACLRFLNVGPGVEIHHDGDLPKQSGLGTSSSFVVGLLNALHGLRGEMPTPMQLAKEAIYVERHLCRETVGSQDQTCAAFGGLNYIRFTPGDIITVRPVTLSAERLELFESHLMLLFTGFARLASEVAADQVRNTPKKRPELQSMKDMVEEALRVLVSDRDILEFGRLLHESWKLKRSLSSRISNSDIDALYERARQAGAVGGKLCGAGGGGFMLLFAAPDRQQAVREALSDRLHVPFRLDHAGSHIIFYRPGSSEERPGSVPAGEGGDDAREVDRPCPSPGP